MKSETFKRAEDAKRRAREVEVEKDRGIYVDPNAAKQPFAPLAGSVLANRQHLRPSTQARDDSLMRNMVLPAFGNRQLGSIRPLEIKNWITELTGRGYNSDTVRKSYELLALVFREAAANDWIARTPCRGIDNLPDLERVERRFLTSGEVEDLADEVTPRFRALVLTGGYAGLRLGECLALKWHGVDLKHRFLVVSETLSEIRGSSCSVSQRPTLLGVAYRCRCHWWPTSKPIGTSSASTARILCSRQLRVRRYVVATSAAGIGYPRFGPRLVIRSASTTCGTAMLRS